jgi:hypothetical protein
LKLSPARAEALPVRRKPVESMAIAFGHSSGSSPATTAAAKVSTQFAVT